MAKENNVKPTNKHKALLTKTLLENRGRVTGEDMLEVGYSEAYSKNPKQLEATKGWQELLDEYIPEDLLQKKLKEGLDATDKDKNTDFSVRHKYLDTAIKLRGLYAPEKKDVNFKGIASLLDGIEDEG